MEGARTPTHDEVTVVSANPETRDGLQIYLRSAGVAARSTSELRGCAKAAPSTTRAFVVFPDDFRWEKVVAMLAELADLHPAALPVLVTAQPQRFEALTSIQVLIVARPAWGWTILDAIRAHRGDEGPTEE